MNGAWKRLAGAIAAPAAWALVTQLGEILPYPDCGARISSSLIAAGAGGGVAILGAAVSFRSASAAPDRAPRFVGYLSSGIAAVFLFALVLQTLATTLVDPCQR